MPRYSQNPRQDAAGVRNGTSLRMWWTNFLKYCFYSITKISILIKQRKKSKRLQKVNEISARLETLLLDKQCYCTAVLN